LRVMGTAFATGQAAGVAAACHARGGHLEAAEVRKVLASQGALLDPADMPAPGHRYLRKNLGVPAMSEGHAWQREDIRLSRVSGERHQ